MRTKNTFYVLACLILFLSGIIFPQATGDFRSNGQGKWNAAGTWQTYNGSAWVNASAAPTGTENITIQTSDSVDVNIPVTITGRIIGMGGKLGNSLANLTFGNNGIYEHAVNAKSVPSAIWGTGSTCLFSAVVDTMPSNNRQNYYNFSWNCPSYGTSALNLGWGGNTIGGNLNIIKGNTSKTYLRLTASNIGNQAPGANVITINGDINILDTTSALTSTGSSGQDTIEIHVNGNITSNGNFNVANGSGAMCTWFISGDLKIQDGLMTTNSNVTTLPDSVIFVGTSKQTFYKADSLGSISNVQFATRPGAIVDLVSTSIGGSATTFTQASGSTLMTSHNRGISGNLSMQGSIKLPVDGNYQYNGIVSQIDSLLPATVNNLYINNPDTVSIIKPTTVNGVLTLKQGILNNSVNAIIIGSTGSVVYAGGHAAVPIQGWPEGIKEGAVTPRVFKLYNNYPNPFNPSTQIRFSVPKDGFTSLKVMNILGQEVATLFEGNAKSGNILEVTFNAKNLSSGIYFARLEQEGKISIQKMNLIK
jgi:Secretion system C-terminal sorting domain